MVDYVTIRRWSSKPEHDEASLLAFVNEGIVPAWRKIDGCLSLNLLRVRDETSYLAVTYWESKEDLDRWSGPQGQQWRDEHRLVLEQWLSFMSFKDEVEADLLVVG